MCIVCIVCIVCIYTDVGQCDIVLSNSFDQYRWNCNQLTILQFPILKTSGMKRYDAFRSNALNLCRDYITLGEQGLCCDDVWYSAI